MIVSCCGGGFHLLYHSLKLLLSYSSQRSWAFLLQEYLSWLVVIFFVTYSSKKHCHPLVAVTVFPWIFLQSPTRQPMSLTSLLLTHTKISACFSDNSPWMCNFHLCLPEWFITAFFYYWFLQVVPISRSLSWSSASSVASLHLLASWTSPWAAIASISCLQSPSTWLNLFYSSHYQLVLLVATYFSSSIDKHIFLLTCSECSHLPIISHVFASCFSYLTKFKWHVYFQSLSWPGPTLPVTCHSAFRRPLLSLIALLFSISCLLNPKEICDNFLPFSPMLWR